MHDRRELKHRYRAYFGVYNRYSVAGFILFLFAISIFGLGCFDVGWTVSRYDQAVCTQNADYPDLDTCGGNHIYTLVATSLWGGALLIINGIMALWMPHRYVAHNRMFQIYTALTFINLMGVAPTILILNVCEIAYNNGIFYDYSDGSFVAIADEPKFVVVFTIFILAGAEFLILAGMLSVACFCPAPRRYRKDYKLPFADWHPHLPHLPHFAHPHFGKQHPHVNPYGRPMMYNAGAPAFGFGSPNGYGQLAYRPAAAPAALPAAAPAPAAPAPAPAPLPVAPAVSAAYLDPYRFYNALAGAGYYSRLPERPPPRRYYRRRDDFSDAASNYSYDSWS